MDGNDIRIDGDHAAFRRAEQDDTNDARGVANRHGRDNTHPVAAFVRGAAGAIGAFKQYPVSSRWRGRR